MLMIIGDYLNDLRENHQAAKNQNFHWMLIDWQTVCHLQYTINIFTILLNTLYLFVNYQARKNWSMMSKLNHMQNPV